jgi:hypothetical protein
MTDESIFAEALGIADPAARAAHLDRACAGNPDLRAAVEALLAAHAAGSPLDRPPDSLARTGAYVPRVENVARALKPAFGTGPSGPIIACSHTRRLSLLGLSPRATACVSGALSGSSSARRTRCPSYREA